ncbi:MAG: hypothetical protein ACT4NL_04895 [Pseudomarimonas sp.]
MFLRKITARACVLAGLSVAASALAADPTITNVPDVRAEFRYASTAIKADISPPLRSMPIIPSADGDGLSFIGVLMVDPEPAGQWKYGNKQDPDGALQDWLGPPILIPATIQNLPVGTGTANPPDPVGDVGINHYVRMSNASFQVFSKTTGLSVFGPANINTLWQGFGGDCENENAGDPIVLYDQLADRWLLSQFSNSTGPGFFNCVALSVDGDPTGQYQRYAFPASVFPDYPKYGVWSDSYVFTTRELGNNAIGTYALDRDAMLAGSLMPTVISFFQQLDPGVAQLVGDGLLPADIDGFVEPPAGSPAYLVGSMDDGGPYGATLDALSFWKLTLDFAVPANSSMVLSAIIPIAPYDTVFPCAPTARDCVAQPAPLGPVDILSYRQRPTFRATYRNYGSYESILANQSVEGAPAIAGIRWWEIRNPATTPTLYQDSTYAPGATDGLHRWMGSIAADVSGNIALGYSASSAQSFPSVRYTGRLQEDPINEMGQGEGLIFQGNGGHTSTTRRWGDYTSMNVDVDDCTFWYINQYFATSGTTWTLRAGSFKFPTCGMPSFGIAAVPLTQQVCTPESADFTIEGHAYSGFTGSATLSANGNPSGSSFSFSPATIASVPGNSTLTINSGTAAFGTYPITVTATGGMPASLRSRVVDLQVYSATPDGSALLLPADNAALVPINPVLSWNAPEQGQTYVAEIATDAAFTNIVFTSAASTQTSIQVPPVLAVNTTYFWRVRSTNICGEGAYSEVFRFDTRPLPGQCPMNVPPSNVFFDNMESGINGWTTTPATGTNRWTQSTSRPFSGTTAWLAPDAVVTTDQQLMSPPIVMPTGQAPLVLRFQHDVNMEENGPSACWDGGFVEVSSNGGTNWTPVPANKVLEDFYYGPLPNGNQAYCGTNPYEVSSMDLDDYAGQTINLRFRLQTDSNTGDAPLGWSVDDVSVISCDLTVIFKNGFESQ